MDSDLPNGNLARNHQTIALVVPTRNRLEYLRPRVPIWSRAGFDQLIVVNTPTDPSIASEIERLCRSHRFQYLETPRTLRDLRSKARNTGATFASTDWVLFSDDDDAEVIGKLDRTAFDRAANGRDWLAGEKGDIVVIHRRSSFLLFGGYPEDMVASEDTIMSNRARRAGRGGPLGSVFTNRVGIPDVPREEPMNRARAHFWYSLTLPLFFSRTPSFEPAIASDARRILGLARRALMGDPRSLVYMILYLAGRALSPAHLLSVLLKTGRAGFRREIAGSWAGARP